jgi:ABC-2 type transport system permease protein
MDSSATATASWRRSDIRASLRLYWEVARRGYRRYATYRGATAAGVFTNTVFGFMRCYILIALFTARPHVGGYTLTDALTYTWLGQGLLMTIYIWGWYEIAERVRSGDVVTDLQRPIDFQLYWLAQDLGRGAYHALFRGVPPFIFGALAFHLPLPTDVQTYACFTTSVALAVCVSFAMRFLVNVLAFWVLDYRGVNGLAAVFWTFLSGSVVPLAIIPNPWGRIAEVLPFAGMMQTPIDVWLQKYQGGALLGIIALQAVWALILLGLGRLVLRQALRKVVVQGG